MQGYVVFSVEHTDGTASAARLAHGGGWLFYQGWGSEEGRMAQTRCTTPAPIPPLLSSRGPLPFPPTSLFLPPPLSHAFMHLQPAVCVWNLWLDRYGLLHKAAYFYPGQHSRMILIRCRHRVAEVLTTLKLLSGMSRGEEVTGLKLSGGFNPKTLLQGNLVCHAASDLKYLVVTVQQFGMHVQAKAVCV